MTDSSSSLAAIVTRFDCQGRFLDAHPYGNGHINDTYLARFVQDGNGRDRLRAYIVQRINHRVFTRPRQVMANMAQVTAYMREKISAAGGDPDRETITLIPTTSGDWVYESPQGEFWRMENFISGAQSYPIFHNPEQVYHAARAFGRFQRLLDQYPAAGLYETIPNFHHTVKRYQAFLQALEKDACQRADESQADIDFALARGDKAALMVTLQEQGQLPLRVTHNDTKFDNVLLDDQSGEGVCVIDLDTVMPGMVGFDFGDMVRSGANPAAEDEIDLSRVVFRMNVFEQIASGFLELTRDTLSSIEVETLPLAAWLITYEQGLRFLTDHLNGDVYYKIHRPGHNLDRCRTQFHLAAQMESLMGQMEKVVEKYRRPSP